MGTLFNNKNISLGLRLLGYYIARHTGMRSPLPFSYTLGLTYSCNLRCQTCRIYDKERKPELTAEEWMLIFKHMGRSPYWVTFSGGEPFLRKDIALIYDGLCSICRPAIVNIPTNGTIDCADVVESMCKTHPEIKLVINVSIDHCIPERNDIIRGKAGAFKRAIETYHKLKELKFKNLTVGVHTVISRFNVADFAQICEYFINLHPDQYITEVAEERIELGTEDLPITPTAEAYAAAISVLEDKVKSQKWEGVARVTESFRLQYYRMVKDWLYGYNSLSCYAGMANLQVDPTGEVWPCCIQAISIGNLRQNSYDVAKILSSPRARIEREEMVDCSCPMANAFYSNALLSPKILEKVITR